MNTISTKWGWLLSVLLLLATLLNYMDRQALSELSTQLKSPDEINLDDGRYGLLEKAFSWSFAIGSIIFGLLVDRFGPRHLYPIALFGWSCAGCACGLAKLRVMDEVFSTPDETTGYGAYTWLFMCRMVLGFFEAGHWPCALVTLRNVLTDRDRPLGNSILQSGASLGAALTPFLIHGLTILGIQWPVTFLCIGLIGLIWLPTWYTLIRKVDLNGTAAKMDTPEPINWGRLSIQLLMLTGLVVSMGLTWQFFRAWLPKFLKENQHYPELFSPSWPTWIIASYYIVADIGCIVSGAFATLLAKLMGLRIDRARFASFVLCTACTLLALFVTSVPPGWLQIGMLLLIGAGTLGLHPHYYAAVQDLPRQYMGVFSGALAAGTWFAVGQMQASIGQQIKATNDYSNGMMIAGLAPLVGLVCLAVLVYVPGLKSGSHETGH